MILLKNTIKCKVRTQRRPTQYNAISFISKHKIGNGVGRSTCCFELLSMSRAHSFAHRNATRPPRATPTKNPSAIDMSLTDMPPWMTGTCTGKQVTDAIADIVCYKICHKNSRSRTLRHASTCASVCPSDHRTRARTRAAP